MIAAVCAAMSHPFDRRFTPGHRPPSVARTVIGASLSTTIGVLPVFLLASLAILIREDIPFGRADLGFGVATFFAASAVGSVPGGRLAERIGARWTLVLANVATSMALIAIATVASSWGHLVGLLIFAGLANAFTQPAANLAIARAVRTGRQGLAFGVKQVAIPVSTLVAGLSVPLVGVTLGWRWAVAGAVGLLFVVAAALPPSQAAIVRKSTVPFRAGLASIITLACCGGMGSAAATAMGAFLVESAVDVGRSAQQGGMLLALGSATGIVSRILAGWLADRRTGGHFHVVAGMIAIGALGYVLLSFGAHPLAFLFGTIIAFSMGWGWNGLFVFAVVQGNNEVPAAVTGVTQLGMFTGGVLGPLSFGLIADTAGFRTAWLSAAATALVASVLVLVAQSLLSRRE